MRWMSITAYAICRVCIAVYPAAAGRRCPRCTGDAESARIVAEATAVALEPAAEARRGAVTRRWRDRGARATGR